MHNIPVVGRLSGGKYNNKNTMFNTRVNNNGNSIDI